MAVWQPADPRKFQEAHAAKHTLNELAQMFGGTYDQIRWYLRYQKMAGLPVIHDNPTPHLAENAVPKLIDQLRIDEDCMVGADFHTPYHSTLWMNRLLGTAKLLGLRTLVLVGDGSEYAAFSTFKDKHPDASWELAQSAEFWWVLSQAFDRIYYLKANHELRPEVQTNWAADAQIMVYGALLRYADCRKLKYLHDGDKQQFIFSDFHHALLGDDFYLCHPGGKSASPILNGNKLAAKHQRNVIVAHHHRAMKVPTDSGRYTIFALGYMGDIQKVGWKMFQVDTAPAWTPGFGVYQDGHFTLYDRDTDWSVIDGE